MSQLSRRSILAGGLGAGIMAALPPAIARAASIGPDVRSGTIQDVDHIVIFMQENRGFDHYFGTMRGVRGFGDRFPIPLAPTGGRERNVWQQQDGKADGGPRQVSPFHLSTRANFDLMRVEGTPHSWPDAQAAWDEGRMGHWPEAKSQRAMGYFQREDIPFQFALADAFTLCDAYHCSVQTGTNTNRLFLWSGTNDPGGQRGGPAIGNSHDNFPEKGGAATSYDWTTVVEQLQSLGIGWQIYQDMADNFTDNPLVGFRSFREAHAGHGDPALKARALTTRGLDALREDVLSGALPPVSYVIATAAGSEHPGPSSPAQGAAYTAKLLDALTADPKRWARTALFIMFDENDGFFDHVPPPAPPSRDASGAWLGDSTIDMSGEHHLLPSKGDADVDLPAYRGRPYGLGPRVPLYVISPWSRGGWVNSQTFDHSSVIRFLEARFGFRCPNISPWRRAVCGDLTSAFDFGAAAGAALPPLPDPQPDARRAATIPHQPSPSAPDDDTMPRQEPGVRRSRPLPYRLDISQRADPAALALRFSAEGAGAVFHVYDRHRLDQPPRRYTVEQGSAIEARWPLAAGEAYDLWVIGPNGFHRHFAGRWGEDEALQTLRWRVEADRLILTVPPGTAPGQLVATRLRPGAPPERIALDEGERQLSLVESWGWYDVTIRSGDASGLRRLAGRQDRPGRASVSDPFAPQANL